MRSETDAPHDRRNPSRSSQRRYFTLRDALRTLSQLAPRTGLERAIHAGLVGLTQDYLGREWIREDGSVLRVQRCLIDANWGTSTDVIYQFCRSSPHYDVLTPSHGRFVGAGSRPLMEKKRKRRETVGLNWRVTRSSEKRSISYVIFDANWWKSFVHARLAVAFADPGNLTLFGREAKQHRLLSEHLTSEYRVKTEGRGRSVDEWKIRPGHTENH